MKAISNLNREAEDQFLEIIFIIAKVLWFQWFLF